MRYINVYRDEEIEMSKPATIVPKFLVEDVLAIALVISKRNGFVSARMSETTGQFSTGSEVAMIIANDQNALVVTQAEVIEAMPAVMSIIDFIDEMEIPKNEFREFVTELKVKTFVGEVSLKKVKLVVAAVGMFLNEQKRKAEIAANANVVSKWLGLEETKIKVKAKVSSIRDMMTRFGPSRIVNAVTPDGGTLVWFASGDISKLRVGGEFVFDAKIKKLTEFKGIKQTVISRPKITVA
jgi:hypothetical protein